MQKTRTIPTFQKIVDTTTTLPNSGSAFQTFYPPGFDGECVIFYGNNTTYEGIYYSEISNPSLQIVSDNHTPITDLNGPPTTNTERSLDAYVSYPAGGLAPCMSQLNTPRPIIVNGAAVFFAANWNTRRAGIFSLDPKRGGASLTLISDSDGYFQGGAFGQPSGAMGGVYVSAVGANPSSVPVGVYTVPASGLVGANPKLLLNTQTATTPDQSKIASRAFPWFESYHAAFLSL
jgi:hypothetical protein